MTPELQVRSRLLDVYDNYLANRQNPQQGVVSYQPLDMQIGRFNLPLTGNQLRQINEFLEKVDQGPVIRIDYAGM